MSLSLFHSVCHKKLRYIVITIDHRCQIHQHFIGDFFGNILAPKITKLKLNKRKLRKSLSYKKFACKILMKLTPKTSLRLMTKIYFAVTTPWKVNYSQKIELCFNLSHLYLEVGSVTGRYAVYGHSDYSFLETALISRVCNIQIYFWKIGILL